jgi:HK97 family phage prohead protease
MLETRTIGGGLDSVAKEGRTLVGYAAKFDSLSENLGGFREVIRPGAFRSSLSDGTDIRALVDHNSQMVIGRRSNGTLRLEEDSIGLRVEIDTPSVSYADDLLELVRGGYVSQMSFGFSIPPGGDEWMAPAQGESLRQRVLKNVTLAECSVVTFPAYQATEVSLRSLHDHERRSESMRLAVSLLGLKKRGVRSNG